MKNENKRQVNIMPMAGDGLRLKGAGHNLPKPLIDINGEPMFIRSAKCMPNADALCSVGSSRSRHLVEEMLLAQRSVFR